MLAIEFFFLESLIMTEQPYIQEKPVTVAFACAEVRAVELGPAGSALDGREVPRDLGQPQAALLRLRGLRLLEIHPLTQCR